MIQKRETHRIIYIVYDPSKKKMKRRLVYISILRRNCGFLQTENKPREWLTGKQAETFCFEEKFPFPTKRVGEQHQNKVFWFFLPLFSRITFIIA